MLCGNTSPLLSESKALLKTELPRFQHISTRVHDYFGQRPLIPPLGHELGVHLHRSPAIFFDTEVSSLSSCLRSESRSSCPRTAFAKQRPTPNGTFPGRRITAPPHWDRVHPRLCATTAKGRSNSWTTTDSRIQRSHHIALVHSRLLVVNLVNYFFLKSLFING